MGVTDFIWRTGGYEAVIELNPPPAETGYLLEAFDEATTDMNNEFEKKWESKS